MLENARPSSRGVIRRRRGISAVGPEHQLAADSSMVCFTRSYGGPWNCLIHAKAALLLL